MKRIIRLGLLSTFLILLSVTGNLNGQEWNQWRGTNRDNRVTGFKAPSDWPEQLSEVWKINVGYGDATPALAGGKLYVFTRIGGDEVLQCLDAESGKTIWKENYSASEVTGPAARHPGPRCTPTVVNGKVVVIGATGIISCHNNESGKLLWRNSDYVNSVPVYFTGMSPIIIDNTCIAHLGGAENGAIIAFELETGEIIWELKGDGPSYASPDIMNFGNTKTVVMQTDRTLMGLSLSDGNQLWKIPTPVERRYYNSSSPVIDDNMIFYSGQGHGTLGVSIAKQGNEYTTKQIWNNTSIGNTYNTPVLKDGYLYGLSERGYLYCLNASNGETEWADTTRHRDFGSVIDAGTVMVSLSSSSNLVVFKPATDKYRQVSMILIAETPTYAHPILSGNRIYIKDEQNLVLYRVK